jgi:hypothetical protein
MAHNENHGQGSGKPGHANGNPGQGGGSDGRKLVTIIVNGTAYEVDKERISYEELLALIEAPALPEGQRYSIQYSKGNSDKPAGTLIEGQSVKVKEDMEFDVTPANRS